MFFFRQLLLSFFTFSRRFIAWCMVYKAIENIAAKLRRFMPRSKFATVFSAHFPVLSCSFFRIQSTDILAKYIAALITANALQPCRKHSTQVPLYVHRS